MAFTMKKFYSAFILIIILFACTQEVKENIPLQQNQSQNQIDSFFCYAKGILSSQEKLELQFDKVDFLFSKKAKEAMIEDGLLEEDEFIPNDIYIRNKIQKIEKLEIDDNVKIFMQTLTYDDYGNYHANEEININKFIELLSNSTERNYINFPFFIKTSNNKIILIKEQYLP
jgi:hypothetical protein